MINIYRVLPTSTLQWHTEGTWVPWIGIFVAVTNWKIDLTLSMLGFPEYMPQVAMCFNNLIPRTQISRNSR